MIDGSRLDALPPLHSLPTAGDYAQAARRRTLAFALGGLLLALTAAYLYTLIQNSTVVVGGDFNDIPRAAASAASATILPLAVMVCLLTPIILWHYPRTSLFVLLAAVCLFELYETHYSDAITDKVPFFWNVNTIFQTYAHANVKAVPLNLMEVFLLTAGACSAVHAVYTNRVNLRTGALFMPILVYIGFVTWGWVHGVMSGGDNKIALQEVRSQFYFLLAYLFAVNVVRDRKQINVLLWIMVLCVGLKGILYTFRRYVTIGGMPLPDQGVGSHEEAFLFDGFVVLLIVLLLCGVHKRMQTVMWLLLPFVVTGNLACNRRAATAAIVVIAPVMILAAYRALPSRRFIVGTVGVILAIFGPVYYQAFKNSDKIYAQPARAIKSNFQPDARDALSNAYRDAEKADLMATIESSPIVGYGYGKRMFHAVFIADISQQYEWWDIMPHNQILWVWMRVGSLGFFAFWMMVAAVLIYICHIVRDENTDNEIKAVGLFTMLVVAMLMMFGLLDLQLSNFRDMLFSGFWVGVIAAAAGFSAPQRVPSRAARPDPLAVRSDPPPAWRPVAYKS